MNNFAQNSIKSSNFFYKKINYLLKSVNVSLELLIGFKAKKIYKFLKKASKIIEDFDLEKQDLKQIAILISNNELQQKKVFDKAIRIIFKFTVEFKKNIIYRFLLKQNFFLIEKFFNKKQIIRC